NRVAEQIKKELGDILTVKLKDPRVGFVTVTDVEVTGDWQEATVYISVLGDEEKAEETMLGLAKANGIIGSEIGKRISLRKKPGISIEYDEALEYGNRIETILKDLEK